MIGLKITTNAEIDPWTDLTLNDLPLNPAGETAKIPRIGLLPNGTREGRATVMFDVVLPDGRHVIAETTWRLLHTAVAALGASPVVEMEEL